MSKWLVAALGGLIAYLAVIAAVHAEGSVRVTSHRDSSGYTQTTVSDGKHTTHCRSHTDSSNVTHTTCDK